VPCHGAEGTSRFPDVPHLAGQNQAYLVAALQALKRSGIGETLPKGLTNRSEALMEHQAVGLTDGSMENLASYYSMLACPTSVATAVVSMPPVARRCESCHAEGGRSEMATVPRLAGQQQRYLENQLRAFRDAGIGVLVVGEPRARFHPIMSRQTKPLGDEDIAALARYFSAQSCN
jgi:sulfide dehydrogenase cytochrome subunit